MAETPTDRHNRLAHEFVMKVARETAAHSELMTVVESTIFCAMLISRQVYGLSAAGSVEMIEMAVQQATTRFTETERAGRG